MSSLKFKTSEESLLTNLRYVKKANKNFYIINVEIFKNKFIYFNKLFLAYSKSNKLKNSFRLSDFFKIVIDFYVEELEEKGLYKENTTAEFENFLKSKKKGKLEGSEMYSGVPVSEVFTHTTIKVDEETYLKYINSIHSYIESNDPDMEYHYSMRKFINVLITYMMQNEASFIKKCTQWQ